jgi:branched-chain amino acid aminotransferase
MSVANSRWVRGLRPRIQTPQWRADTARGKLKEAFACGPTAVISPIGKVCSASGDFLISGGAAGPVAMGFRKKLVDIQYGRADDPHNWIRTLV